MSDEKDLKQNSNTPEEDFQGDSIDEILKAFKSQKEQRQEEIDHDAQIEPPKIYDRAPIDFSAEEKTDTEESESEKKPKRRWKKPNVDYKKLFTGIGIVLGIIAIGVGVFFGVRYAVNASKTAYLAPYESKYPDVEFPAGIMEKYCDTYGTHPTAVGYISISDTDLNAPVLSQPEDNYPYAENNEIGYEQVNYVVYLNDNSLEEYYASADAYNEKASGYISYSDLFDEYRFKVVGAFYTNTVAEDDDGYIFPYNVTEKMTAKSFGTYLERLQNRFIYDVGMTLTRQDTILTVSCPTDYRENFRFVVIGVLRNDSTEKPEAQSNSRVRYPQVIYDEQGTENPYRFASDWYPEIVRTDSKGNEIAKQQSITDYE